MILDIYKFLAEFQSKINGNPEISLCIAENKFYIRVLWYKEEKKFVFKYQFNIFDILNEEDYLLEVLIQRINREYAQKQLEERNE